MKKIPLSRALLFFLDELEYTEAALSADPEVAELAAPFAEEIEAWNAIFQKERGARRAVVRAEAVVAVRNEQLDAATTKFGGMVFVEAGQKRDTPFYKRFFKTAVGEFVKQGLRKQAEKTRDEILPELAKLEAGHVLKGFEAPLKAAVKAALGALDARNKDKGALAGANNEVDEWKEGVNRLRTTTYAELLKIAANKVYPKSWVETFFRADASDTTSDAPEPTLQPTTPTGA